MAETNIFYYENRQALSSVSIDKIYWEYMLTLKNDKGEEVTMPIDAHTLQEMADSLRSYIKGRES